MVRYKEKFPPPFIVSLYFTPSSINLWPCPFLSSTRGVGSGSDGLLIAVSLSALAHTPCGSKDSPLGCSFLQGISICHSLGSSPGCSGVSDSPYPPWAWGNSLLPFSPSMGCRNISALAPETLPSLFLHWPCVCGMTSHAFLFLLTPFSHCHEAFSLYSLFPEGITSSLAGTAGSVHGAALAFPHRDQHCPSLSTANSWTPMPNTKPDTSFPKNVK